MVQFLALCALPPALITEYCARGSLYDCLQAARADPAAAAQLTWARRLAMVSAAGAGGERAPALLVPPCAAAAAPLLAAGRPCL